MTRLRRNRRRNPLADHCVSQRSQRSGDVRKLLHYCTLDKCFRRIFTQNPHRKTIFDSETSSLFLLGLLHFFICEIAKEKIQNPSSKTAKLQSKTNICKGHCPIWNGQNFIKTFLIFFIYFYETQFSYFRLYCIYEGPLTSVMWLDLCYCKARRLNPFACYEDKINILYIAKSPKVTVMLPLHRVSIYSCTVPMDGTK